MSQYALTHDILATLAWNYIDTLIGIAGQMRISELKGVSRRIREAQRAYDRLRQRCLLDNISAYLVQLSDIFEDECEAQLNKLCYGVANDRAASGLEGENMFLVKAVQMAMAVLDAVAINSDTIDAYMEREQLDYTRRRADACFGILRTLVPLYAGDCYAPRLEARRIVARVLYTKASEISQQIIPLDENQPSPEQ